MIVPSLREGFRVEARMSGQLEAHKNKGSDLFKLRPADLLVAPVHPGHAIAAGTLSEVEERWHDSAFCMAVRR